MSINATLIIQMIVFAILVWFTMKFVWPPITAALDERAKKIADGLSAADKAKAELSNANKRVEEQLSAARNDAAQRLADAERLAQRWSKRPRAAPAEEGAKIIAAAKAEAEQEVDQGARSPARAGGRAGRQGRRVDPAREVNAGVHAELLNRLKAEL